MSDMTPKQAVGCALIFPHILVLLPAWFALLFWVLSATDAPTWAWGIYWAYMPTSFITTLIGRVAVIIIDDD